MINPQFFIWFKKRRKQILMIWVLSDWETGLWNLKIKIIMHWTNCDYLLYCCCYWLVIKSCLTLCNCMEWSPQGSSVHEIFQARTLKWVAISSNFLYQFSSVTHSCLTLFDPMNCSTPGLPVHHKLPEFTQTHVHWVSDAIQPSHPLSSCSPLDLNLSQHQGLFKWVSFLHQVAKVLEFQLQHQSFQWTPMTYLL